MKLSIEIFPPLPSRDPALRRESYEDILLIHGMGSASTAWSELLPKLRKNFRVITVDLPGHGKTPLTATSATDPIALAHLLHDEMVKISHSYHLVGNSLGGWIALEMAAHFPAPVKSVTALAPAGLWINPFQRRYPATAFLRMFARSTKAITPFFLHFQWAKSIGFANVSPQWRKFSYQLSINAVKAISQSEGYYPLFDGMLMKRFDGVIDSSIPVTIIFGDSDNTLPAKTCQEKSLAPKHARWVILPNSGHAPMWDSVDDVMEEILLISVTV